MSVPFAAQPRRPSNIQGRRERGHRDGAAGGRDPVSVGAPGRNAHHAVAGVRDASPLFRRHLPGERGRELLADCRGNALELGYRDELNTDVGNRIDGRIVRVRRVDRAQRHLGEIGGLDILRILVERCPGAGRNIGPAFLRRDEFEVGLRRGPLDEFLRGGLLLRTRRDRQRPRPEPVAALAEPVVGRQASLPQWRQSQADSNQHFVLIAGRVVLDGIDTLRAATYNFASFALESVAQELLGRGKLIHDATHTDPLYKAKEIRRQFREEKQTLAAYNLEDCQLVWDIFEHTDLINFSKIISAVNRQLAFDVEDSGQFMTMFYLNLDTKSHNFTWVRAGHDPAIVYDPHSDLFTRLDAPGIALGVDGDWRYEQNEQPLLSNGQIVLLGTDGIWEVRNQAGEMLGKTPIMDIIRQNATATATQILDAIFDRLESHVQGAKIEDDITAVIIKSRT